MVESDLLDLMNQNWLNTPDGRQGWASWFVQNGYTVYIVDQPQRGRSAYNPDGSLGTFSAEAISTLFTGVQYLKLWPQAHLHTQWPGVQVQTKTQNAGAALLDRIGPAVLIAHSEGGPLGFTIADVRPSLVKALISIEPEGPPFEDRFPPSSKIKRPFGLTNIPITYDPPVRDPATDLPINTTPRAGPHLSNWWLRAKPVFMPCTTTAQCDI
ncbi:hypothetical protein OEA41_005453 [Lepraria neglecta]|uniref:AB hydrolase-1 domain-containing protein n=1 Tax=Lepraria neglecta TaxID=209136 RepID=A0AAD9Z0J3_9LECA|nr:hypothetical protein OEA41_005453 [Lepraria neglecta]